MASLRFHLEQKRRERRRLGAELYVVRAGGFGIGLVPAPVVAVHARRPGDVSRTGRRSLTT